MLKEKMYIRGNYDVCVPAHLNFGKYMLDRLRRFGNDIAIENAQTGEKITYSEMVEYAVKLSVALVKLGVRKGDVVALGSEKRLMFMPTALGIVLSGATYTPYDFTSGRAHLHHKMTITRPRFCITTKLFWKTNRETLKSFDFVETFLTLDEPTENLQSVTSLISTCYVDLETFEPITIQGQVDTAAVFYSSGTTGMPKGVQMSHLNAILYARHDDFKKYDNIRVAYISGDWFHNYDSYMTYKMLARGAKVVFTTDLIPEIMVKGFIKGQVNLVFLVPSLVNLLSKTSREPNENLECFKYIYVGASPIHAKTMEQFKKRFPSIESILQGYGMTETWELTSENWSPKGTKLGSVGCVSPCITLKVEDPVTRELLGPNKPGEICLKGPVFMKGYIGVDPSTYLDADGFFRSGDLGYYDEDGYFFIVDRLKEIIDYDGYKGLLSEGKAPNPPNLSVSHGSGLDNSPPMIFTNSLLDPASLYYYIFQKWTPWGKVAPLELETIIMLHPGIKESGVVGKPVPVYGEEPTAFVVRQPNSSVTEQEVIDFVAAEVAPYMQLKGGVKFVTELPRNPRGKLLRRRLREMLLEDAQ